MMVVGTLSPWATQSSSALLPSMRRAQMCCSPIPRGCLPGPSSPFVRLVPSVPLSHSKALPVLLGQHPPWARAPSAL